MLTDESIVFPSGSARVKHAATVFLRLFRQIAEAGLMPLAYLILPNLPLLFLTTKLNLTPHGYINAECLLLGACSVFLPRPLIFLLLIPEMVGAFVYELCYTYQFRLAELFASIQFLQDLPLDRKLEAAAGLGLVITTAWVTAYKVPRPRYRRAAAASLLVMIAILSAVDVVDGQNPFISRDTMLFSRRLTMSPWLVLAVRERADLELSARSLDSNTAPMVSASSHAVEYLDGLPAGVRPDVVEVVVESWGLLRDTNLQQAILAPYEDPRITAAYEISSGTVPFDGLTIPGESRELCQSHLGFGIFHISDTARARCLPMMFDTRGYETEAIHGYLRGMFERRLWYQRVGFTREWFETDLRQERLPLCNGAFPGICDTYIAEWIGKRLLADDAHRPKFVYWMTLNSHIPVPENPNLPADTVCSEQPVLGRVPALCSWLRLVHAVHQSIAQVALQQAHRPTVFVLVGDHAPPFASPELRAEFSATAVPYVLLTPKALDAFGDRSFRPNESRKRMRRPAPGRRARLRRSG